MRSPTRPGILALALLLGACSSPAPHAPVTVVALSDVHFDPFFDPALFPSLQSSPESDWKGLFEGAGHHGPGTWGHTTNYELLRQTLDAIEAQDPPPALVVFGGDILVQEFSTIFQIVSGSDDPAAMRAFALKTVSFVVHQVRASLGSTPVYFTLGNWDSYGGSFALEPNDPFLADTAALFRDGLLAGTVDRAAFDATYLKDGSYVAEVPGSPLLVVGLNTIFLAPQAPSDAASAVNDELDWLDRTLAAAEASGRPVWIVTHVPPGGDLATTGSDVDPQGHITQPTMLLQADPQGRLLSILAAHRGIVTAAFTGHTHMDEYRLAAIALQGLPGVTAVMGNSPAFKTFTIGGNTAPQDYVSWALDLGSPAAGYQPYYDFSTAYGIAGSLGVSQQALLPELRTSATAEAGYRDHYGSGHAPTKPITDVNWPVYWCGIAVMGEQDLAGCVNGQ